MSLAMGRIDAMKLIIKILFLILYTIHPVVNKMYTNIIQLPQGKVRGLRSTYCNCDKFLGIPYASVAERFQSPTKPPSWNDVLDATKEGTICNNYLPRLNLPVGHENCLFLNIYVPTEIDGLDKLPVMVFIQDVSISLSSGTTLMYDPELLVRKGVIVVTVNYRTGAFGFLCLRIKGASGNAGLKDLVAALQWININIKYFDGNPQSVTIFGQGVGSSLVNYLILSPAAEGLFHRAIMQSGTALSPFAYTTDPIDKAALVASKLGYNTKNPYDLLKILQNTTAIDIVMASVSNNILNPLSKYVFRPCTERSGVDPAPFIIKSPTEILESGNYNKVPTIIGYNDKEGIAYVSQYKKSTLNELYKNFYNALPDNLYFTSAKDQRKLIDNIKDFYFVNKYQNANSTENIINYFSDILFHYPSIAMTELFLKNSEFPIYNYYFKYDSYRNLAKFISGMKNQKGASHGDELFYLFQPQFIWPLPKIDKDMAVIDLMTTMWTDFAKIGDPANSFSNKRVISKNGNIKFIVLDQSTWISSIPNRIRIEFWKDVYEKYGNL